MDQNRLALLALHFIPGLGDYTIRQLISYSGSAEKVFQTPKGKLLKIPGIGTVTADAIQKGKPFELANHEIRKAEKENVQLIFFMDRNYPSRLKQINDAPSLLYVKGNVDFENKKMVAIVGTRKATGYGKHCVEDLITGLVSHGATIVSGLAYGIDIHAHKQAIRNNLPTLGVMGSGMDVIYPASHKETARKMFAQGGLITEHPFGTKPDAHNFPARNRIVAALSDAVVIVEAAATGGALITADIANSYNKDVFAYPGNIGQNTSEGCNQLIKTNKAFLITSVKDLEYLMNWDLTQPGIVKKPVLDLDQFNEDEKTVIRLLLENKNQLMIDELSWRSGIGVSQLASILLTLEFQGYVTPLPGKQYKLK
ncbi:MAG TPA: DNA-processing protein DprA [Ohtaekwangia sp.]|nr:DNA-processing protein DprA [Ohtaekwangia sp.]